MARKRLTQEERYWQKVDRGGADDCWEWTAARNKLGYGLFLAGGLCVLAHRYGWRLATGEEPGELCVLHHCDNPPCQNPAHLFLGTRQENIIDRDRKGRQARGAQVGASRFSEDEVRSIHRRYSEGVPVPRLAEEFGASKGAIDAMVNGRSWTHLDLNWGTRPGRLNPERVRDIRRRFASGENRHAIAAEYRIRPKHVNEVVSRRRWASVA